MKQGETGKITIAEIAKRAGVSSATVSYVISGRQDVKIGEETRRRILALCSELGYEKGAARKSPSKVTIDDIAREAGVSTATVSYIINDRTDVKISEETRRKVLQICNLWQYSPSSVARLLAGKKANLIGICLPTSPFPLQNAGYFSLLSSLCHELHRQEYDAVVFSPDGLEHMHIPQNLEGILCIDLTEGEFYALKERSFVPIVAVDMIVDNPLFFKTYPDHAAVIGRAKALLHTPTLTFVGYPPRNQPSRASLEQALQGDTMLSAASLPVLLEHVRSHPEEHYLFADEQLFTLCSPLLSPDKLALLSQTNGASEGEAIATGEERTDCGTGAVILSLPHADAAVHAVQLLQSAMRRETQTPHTRKRSPR